MKPRFSEYKINGYVFKIRQDFTVKGNRFYCVMQNPFNDNYDTKQITGGSIEIVQRKLERQYKNFEKLRG